jgi:enoyl-CoA hydratase
LLHKIAAQHKKHFHRKASVMSEVSVIDKPVLTEVIKGVGRITLNRPKVLNALNTEMCTQIYEALQRFASDDKVLCVVLDHTEGTRGFCAGGDIRAVAESGRKDGVAARAFFKAEYRLNTLIKTFPKPFISLMDGVTMGGGVGLSVHATYRIATENTLFAMPETGIGLFPDVGGGWFLPRLEGELGLWLALTGTRLKGAEVKAAQIATHFIHASDLGALKAEVFSLSSINPLADILSRFDRPVGTAHYHEHIEAMNRIFGKPSLADICIALKLEDSDWAQHQGEILATRSPFSMAVTLRQLREGRQMQSFQEVMQMEYRIASRICQSHDFLEGVRAVLIDKDHAPQWEPRSIGGITLQGLEAMFLPLERELYS